MTFPITTLFLDIGGVLLSNGWDRQARALAATTFGLDATEMDERHHLTFATFEEGRLTLDEYLGRVVFHEARSFSLGQFKAFMLEQSRPHPEMIDLVRRLKARHRLKIAVVSNEGRELTEHRIKAFELGAFVDFFVSSCFVHLRKPDADIYRLALDISQVAPAEVVYIEDRPMFVAVARSLGIAGIVHSGYAVTQAALAAYGLSLQTEQSAAASTSIRSQDRCRRGAREMTSIDDMKHIAARAAVDELPTEGVIGLGTGSTTTFFLEALAEVIRAGRRLIGVATSEQTRQRALILGIPLLSDEGPWSIAVSVDGADEVDPSLDLIKGAGGAFAREKIVNAASDRNVIIVDETKRSPRLGTRCPIPIEVLAFAHLVTRAHLERYGTPVLRIRGGMPMHTDAGNLIYDLRVDPIADVGALAARLRTIPGVVETGLFVARADVVLVGSVRGLIRLERTPR